MHIEWLPAARATLLDITDYIANHSVEAALKLHISIELATEQLPNYPYLYRQGRVANTREMLVHPNYLVVYRVGLHAIQIVDVLHTRQQYPALTKKTS